ncbi:MAG TPA: hypothetical protein VNH15_01355 [Elusimicrobiota bacterium]|nr:hypothetical protein [Elusimicrobiota bacterium]
MAPTLGLLCADPEARQELSLLAGEAGYGVLPAGRVEDMLEILRERRPDAVLIADAENDDAAQNAREVLRAAPTLPIVAAARRRDASRAVLLMRLGVCEVIPPPWTRENAQSCLDKALASAGTVVSLRPRPRPRRLPLYFLALAGFLALCFGILSARHAARERALKAAQVNFWDVPYRHPAGLAFDGKDLWAADWFAQSYYVHSPPDLKIARTVHFTNQTPLGILFAQGEAWRLSASGLITRGVDDDNLTPLQKYRTDPGTVGMAFDGLYLWTLDNRHVLHQHIMDVDLTEIASYHCPDPDPTAVVYDGKTLWLLDSSDRELVRLNLERPDEAVGFVPLTEYADGRYRPTGLAWDGRAFWTIGEKIPHGSGPARIFRHPVGSARP